MIASLLRIKILSFSTIICILFCQSFSLSGQCRLKSEEAIQLLDNSIETSLKGIWEVNIRGTLFTNTQILQTDFNTSPSRWLVIPEDSITHRICLFEDAPIQHPEAIFIQDPIIKNQYFYQANDKNEHGQVISFVKSTSKNAITFSFMASKSYIKRAYSDQVSPEQLDNLSLVWEYILTRFTESE